MAPRHVAVARTPGTIFPARNAISWTFTNPCFRPNTSQPRAGIIIGVTPIRNASRIPARLGLATIRLAKTIPCARPVFRAPSGASDLPCRTCCRPGRRADCKEEGIGRVARPVTATGRGIAEAIADLLAVERRFAGSMRLARLAETLPAINWLQTVGSLERQHPPWILRRKSADLIQLPKLVLVSVSSAAARLS